MRILVICTLLSASFAAFAKPVHQPLDVAGKVKTVGCSEINSGPKTGAPIACFVEVDGLDGQQLAMEYSNGAAVFNLDVKLVAPGSYVGTATQIGTIRRPILKEPPHYETFGTDLVDKKQVGPLSAPVKMEYEGRQLKRLTVGSGQTESVYENFIAQ